MAVPVLPVRNIAQQGGVAEYTKKITYYNLYILLQML